MVINKKALTLSLVALVAQSSFGMSARTTKTIASCAQFARNLEQPQALDGFLRQRGAELAQQIKPTKFSTVPTSTNSVSLKTVSFLNMQPAQPTVGAILRSKANRYGNLVANKINNQPELPYVGIATAIAGAAGAYSAHSTNQAAQLKQQVTNWENMLATNQANYEQSLVQKASAKKAKAAYKKADQLVSAYEYEVALSEMQDLVAQEGAQKANKAYADQLVSAYEARLLEPTFKNQINTKLNAAKNWVTSFWA